MRIIVSALLLGVAIADKPDSPVYTGTKVSPVSPISNKNAEPKSDSYSSPQTDSYASPQSSPVQQQTAGDVGTQGYYYYYYPVGQNGNAGSNVSPYTTESDDGLLGGLLAGKGLLVALLVGGLIILAIAGTTISFTGRSLTDLTNYAVNNLDDITSLAFSAIEVYESLNNNL